MLTRRRFMRLRILIDLIKHALAMQQIAAILLYLQEPCERTMFFDLDQIHCE